MNFFKVSEEDGACFIIVAENVEAASFRLRETLKFDIIMATYDDTCAKIVISANNRHRTIVIEKILLDLEKMFI